MPESVPPPGLSTAPEVRPEPAPGPTTMQRLTTPNRTGAIVLAALFFIIVFLRAAGVL